MIKRCESRERKGGFIKKFGQLNLKMILVLICVRVLLQTTVSGKQLQGGHIETNPGPA